MKFCEDKKYMTYQHLISAVPQTILLALFYINAMPARKLLLFSSLLILVNSVVFIRNIGRSYCIDLNDYSLEYCDTCKNGTDVYRYSDIRSINSYLLGVVLILNSGPVRRVKIETITLRDRGKFKEVLFERWRGAVYGNKSKEQIRPEDNQ